LLYLTIMGKEELKKYLTAFLKKRGVQKASLFGSIAREDNTDVSDIDLLIKLPENKSLLDLIGIKIDLEEALNKKVDVLTYNSVHPLIKEDVFKYEEVLYE
jgi:predicted nucleotidyltransferase